MRPLANAALAYLVSSAITGGINLILLPLLARHLGPEAYGSIGVFLSLLTLIGATVGWNIQGWMLRRLQEPVPIPGLGWIQGLCIAAPAALLAGLWCIMPMHASATLSIPHSWLWYALAASAAQALLAWRCTMWQAAGRDIVCALVQAGTSVAAAALTLLLVFGLGWGAEGRVLGLTLVTGAVALIASLPLTREHHLWRPADLAATREALAYGGPLVLHVVASWALLLADRALVTIGVGLEAAGRYYAAAQLAQVITLVGDAANRAWVPWLYRHLASRSTVDQRSIVTVGRRWLAANLCLAAVVAWTFPPLAAWLLGEAYAECGPWLAILAGAYAADASYKIWINILFYHGKTGWVLGITAVSGSVCVLTAVIAMPSWGAAGAAVGVLAGALVSCGLAALLAQRVHPLPWLGSESGIAHG